MWKTFPEDIPGNGVTVWIRVKYYYSSPFLAVYASATQEFTSVTNSIVYPAWTIARWKTV
jgi:hypothetical protein